MSTLRRADLKKAKLIRCPIFDLIAGLFLGSCSTPGTFFAPFLILDNGRHVAR